MDIVKIEYKEGMILFSPQNKGDCQEFGVLVLVLTKERGPGGAEYVLSLWLALE